MTLPASFPLSMSQVAAELGLSLPLSINHPWVILLSGNASPPALPVSFSQLLGQSGNYQFSGLIQQNGNFDYFVGLGENIFFGSLLDSLHEGSATGVIVYTINSSAIANPQKIIVTNKTENKSAVLSQVPGTGTGGVNLQWQLLSGSIGIFGNAGQTHNFTIYPST